MTSGCRPGEDWVESVTEEQKVSTTIDTKRTCAEAMMA